MSIELCSSCGEMVDTDDEPECYIGDTCICGKCQEANEEAVYLAELNRDYAKDRI